MFIGLRNKKAKLQNNFPPVELGDWALNTNGRPSAGGCTNGLADGVRMAIR
jgi:hypothetical protein